MTTIVTRAGKGSALTHNEVDTNFTNLNSAKYESGNNATLGTIQGSTITATTAFSGALNGTVGATTPAAGTFTSLSNSGNLTFTGTGNRIRGDFSNGTVANRVTFQTSITDGQTSIQAIPNGTNTFTSFDCLNSNDIANAALMYIGINGTTDARIVATRRGTGAFLPMTFFTGGSERMRIDTSGNVGIGTSSPQVNLDVNNADSTQIRARATTNGVDLRMFALGLTGNAGIFGTYSNHPLVLYTNTTERMRIDSSGNVGIGTSTTGSNDRLRVEGSEARIRSRNSTSGAEMYIGAMTPNEARLWASTSTDLTFGTNNAERMRISSDGNLYINSTSNNVTVGGYTFETSGYWQVYRNTTSAGFGLVDFYSNWGATKRNVFRVTADGNVLNFNNSYGSISDQSIKENIKDASPKLDDLLNVKIRNFNMIGDDNKQIGVIAQELEKVFPSMVSEGEDGIKSVKYSVFVPMLVKAIQELNAKVNALEAQLQGN
jgi:hypothetical protein